MLWASGISGAQLRGCRARHPERSPQPEQQVGAQARPPAVLSHRERGPLSPGSSLIHSGGQEEAHTKTLERDARGTEADGLLEVPCTTLLDLFDPGALLSLANF